MNDMEKALDDAFDAYDKHAPWRGTQRADFLRSLSESGYVVERDGDVDGLKADLDSVIAVIFKHGNERALNWLRMNYPRQYAAMLAAAQEK